MNVVRVKPGVVFGVIAPAGFRILAAIDAATRVLNVDLEITCGNERHPPGDPHTTGEAFDVGTLAIAAPVVLQLMGYLRSRLGDLFTVLYEAPALPRAPELALIATINPDATAPHVHAQRKRGTIYPPAASAPGAA